jgi:hypothetical protein
MNRQIKFRVWYYDQKKFDYNVGFEDFKKYSFPLYWCCVQQFTGLKDKKGNDIYEGDVLSALGNTKGEYTVEYDCFRACFKAGGFYINSSNVNSICTKDMTVIGNIFEKELAKD